MYAFGGKQTIAMVRTTVVYKQDKKEKYRAESWLLESLFFLRGEMTEIRGSHEYELGWP